MKWYQDPAQFRKLYQQHGSMPAVAAATGTNLSTLKHWSIRHLHDGHPITPVSALRSSQITGRGVSPARTSPADPDVPTITSDAYKVDDLAPSPQELVRSRGLDPNDWEITPTVKEWQALAPEGEIVILRQTICHLKRRVPLDVVMPARTDAPIVRTKRLAAKRDKTNPILIALPSDQHCDQDDKGLRACWLEWCRVNQPGRIIGLGDITNLAKPSRHRPNLGKKFNGSPGADYQGAHDWWRETIDAAPGAVCEQLPGNHDLRASIASMERLPDLHDVCRPGEAHPWHDFEYMVGLDKLGVKYHRPEGEYHSVTVQVADGFAVTHGAKAGPYGGAAKDMTRHEGSRATGHDHKQALTHVVRYRDGEAHLHVAVSVGTMAARDLGYQSDPDAQQGFGTLVIHPCGYWNVELARYDDRRGVLVWRDQMYRA